MEDKAKIGLSGSLAWALDSYVKAGLGTSGIHLGTQEDDHLDKTGPGAAARHQESAELNSNILGICPQQKAPCLLVL